jgi:hypothetical protein
VPGKSAGPRETGPITPAANRPDHPRRSAQAVFYNYLK